VVIYRLTVNAISANHIRSSIYLQYQKHNLLHLPIHELIVKYAAVVYSEYLIALYFSDLFTL